jgi:hypothetical protein
MPFYFVQPDLYVSQAAYITIVIYQSSSEVSCFGTSSITLSEAERLHAGRPSLLLVSNEADGERTLDKAYKGKIGKGLQGKCHLKA